MANRDSYNGLLQSPYIYIYNWVVFHPQGFGHCSSFLEFLGTSGCPPLSGAWKVHGSEDKGEAAKAEAKGF